MAFGKKPQPILFLLLPLLRSESAGFLAVELTRSRGQYSIRRK